MPYHILHSGWMVLGCMADHRPHNLLVPGSSPGCPTFSTTYFKGVFAYYALRAERHFYANFTHSTGLNWNHPVSILSFFSLLFSLSPLMVSTLRICLKIYQVFFQMRKKCVICNAYWHYQYSLTTCRLYSCLQYNGLQFPCSILFSLILEYFT
jgi:hypothetical protein